MSDNADTSDGRHVDRKAMILLSGYYAPVLAHLLREGEARYRNDPLQLEAITALREDLERQIYEQFPDKGWLFNHD